MTNITTKGGLRFIKDEGINKFPSLAILCCKLFYKDEPEGIKAGITEKIKEGDDLIYNKAMTNYTEAIIDKRDEMMNNLIAFKADNTNKYIGIIKVIRSDGMIYKVYHDKVLYGTTFDSTNVLLDLSNNKTINKSEYNADESLITVVRSINYNKIIRIIKRSSDYVICCTDGIYVYSSSTTKYKYINILINVVINDIIYTNNRFFAATTSGIYFSKNTFALESLTFGTDLNWKNAIYKFSTIPATYDPQGVELTPATTSNNGLDVTNIYKFIAVSGTDIYAYSATAKYVCPINDIIQNYDDYGNISTSFTLMSINNIKYIGSDMYACTTTDCTNITSNAIIISEYSIIDIIKIESIYVMLTSNGNIIFKPIGSGAGERVFAYTNGVIPGSYLFLIDYIENDVQNVSALSLTTAVSMCNDTDNKFTLYPIHYIHNTMYQLTSQNVAKFTFNTLQFYTALYNQSSIYWNKLLYVNGLPINFMIIRLNKPNGVNSIWYMCGNDDRRGNEYAGVCSEFGIGL